MKTATIIMLATILFSSCSLNPRYREWKKNQQTNTGTTNPYGVPQASGDIGFAPYQPLPGIAQPATPASFEISGEPPVPSAGDTSHTVVSGDSLWGLARKYSSTIEAIQIANGLTNTNIRTGQILSIPGR